MFCPEVSALYAVRRALVDLFWGLVVLLARWPKEEKRQEVKGSEAWACRRGGRVLVLVGGAGVDPEIEAAAQAAGSMVHIDIAGLTKGVDEVPGYDVVILDRCLGGLVASAARASVLGVCAGLDAGATLVVRDVAVVPDSLVLGGLRHIFVDVPRRLVAALSRRAPPLSNAAEDFAVWLPADMRLEGRRPIGWLHEATSARKLSEAPHAAVERLRRLYGDTSMAFCASPGAERVGRPEDLVRHFLLDGGAVSGGAVGYVAYTEHVSLGARIRLTVMDPVCAPAAMEQLLAAFVKDCYAARARPVFSCVGPAATGPLQRLGFHTTMLGGEVGIPLEQFRLPKERCRYLRTAPAKGLECFPECYDHEELLELNAEWVRGKGMGAEMGIWTYPPSMPRAHAADSGTEARDEVQRLFTYQDGQLVGFVCAEPYYCSDGSGEVLGYGLNTIRFVSRGAAPSWASDFTIATLIQRLQAEGKAKYLAFGLSPWTDLTAYDGDLPWLRMLFQGVSGANIESFYSVRGLAKKKMHHCARQGVQLDARFIAGVPFYAFPDFLRFSILLFGENLARLPGCLSLLLQVQAASYAKTAYKHIAHVVGGRRATGDHA